jgi:hypothetical protein
MAQQYAARSGGRRNAMVEAKDNGTAQEPDYQRADFSRLERVAPPVLLVDVSANSSLASSKAVTARPLPKPRYSSNSTET